MDMEEMEEAGEASDRWPVTGIDFLRERQQRARKAAARMATTGESCLAFVNEQSSESF
jgi:hypothetical protein